MKKFFTLAIMGLAMTSMPFGAMASEHISPVSVENSDCLGTRSDNIYTGDEDVNKWEITYNDGILTVTWMNFVANCCSEGFKTWFERDGDKLIFNAEENEALCNCICNFDVTSTFGQIEPGHYTITFCNYGHEVFTAEIDIEEGADISLSKKPSGIRAISPANEMVSLSADGVLHIASEGKVTVEIFDASGATHARINADSNADIDIKSLPKGIYLAKAKAGNRIESLRFVR